METEQNTENQILQLQEIEGNLRHILMKKQTIQAEEIEVNNAVEELKKVKGETYKIIGPIMVSTDKESLEKDLVEKKEVIDIKLKAITKQENQMQEKAKKIQEEVLKNMNKDKNE